MGLLTSCPAGAAIGDIPIYACPESFGQIQKAILQRIYSTGTTKNTIADPTLLASWSALLSASDGTKVVQTPYLSAPTSEAGEAITYGGGNDTLGGVELTIGRNPSTFTANILHSPQETIKALKEYADEEIGVWLIDEFGRIGCIADNATTPTTYYPIPVYQLFVGDKMFGGFDAPDMNQISWKLYPNWSDNFKIQVPSDFNAKTDLSTPESGS